jgi:EF hand
MHLRLAVCLIVLMSGGAHTAHVLPLVRVEAQPLAANIQRVVEALDSLGAPLPADLRAGLTRAGQARDATKLQELLDTRVLLSVHINPEARVKVARGPAPAVLQQAGYTPVLVKIVNQSGGTQRLRIGSPQSGPVYAGMSKLSGERMQQQHLRENENTERRTDRFLELEMLATPPMTATLSGLEVEYAVALMYSSESGRREATVTFDVGQGTEDLGFRAEVPVLFTVKPAIAVKLSVLDHDGTPTTARFQFVDQQGHVFPPQAKRSAPDLFFQKHIYRAHGEDVLLPPGDFTMFYGRGPEYRWIKRAVKIFATSPAGHGDRSSGRAEIAVRLERWIDPAARGFYSGDHHVHAAGCAHYTSPTEGVDPAVMFRQIKGEGLNVGSVLTWGPGFDHQQQFFAPTTHTLSEPLTAMKYDIEVSGFGSEALGHLVLLDLKEQIYPGAHGSNGWPTWTLPVLRWTRAQGGVGGYAHSGSGLEIDPAAATARLLAQFDHNRDGRLDAGEVAQVLLPEPFAEIDTNHDGLIGEAELKASHHRAADQLPNFAIPELNSVGAQEIFVTAAHGVTDFISAMDTNRIREWNAWYHLMNAGLAVKASGETDFPCMSGTRVGQGRSYVQLGRQRRVDYPQWCRGIARGRSYVSDGYAHALGFDVDGKTSGDELQLARPASVTLKATVAFSPETPLEPAYGSVIPVGGRRDAGDTVIMREPQSPDPVYQRGQRLVEVVVNGRVVASREVPADGREHPVEFSVPIERSSWIALRQFPQLHTNPVNVLVAGKPIRASRESALWALACVDQLWRVRARRIAPGERAEAEKAYEEARVIYRRIAGESPSQR